MAKKDKPLKHNPFAALMGTPSLPEQAAETAPEPPAPKAAHKAPEPAPEPKAKAKAKAEKAASGDKGKTRGRLVLRRETKHRGGKAVIIVTGFAGVRDFTQADTEALAKQLKQQLGCGGTVEGTGDAREIVLQGDRAAKVAELLRTQGFRVDGVTS
jgi:translation initiation factor 1 (eIF-1/SUI1)